MKTNSRNQLVCIYWKKGESNKFNRKNRKLWQIRHRNSVKRFYRKFPELSKKLQQLYKATNVAANKVREVGKKLIALTDHVETNNLKSE